MISTTVISTDLEMLKHWWQVVRILAQTGREFLTSQLGISTCIDLLEVDRIIQSIRCVNCGHRCQKPMDEGQAYRHGQRAITALFEVNI